jgi:hypothetical protein
MEAKMSHVRTFARIALWALPVWALLLFLGTLTHQPDPQTAFPDFAAYVTTGQFLWSHLLASIAGAAIGSIGAIALMLHLLDSKAAGRAIAGAVALVAGNTLLTSIFGIAAFAQPAMGRLFLAGQQNALDFYNQVYAAPLFGTAALGLLLFIVGGVFSGLAIAAAGCLPRWTGWVVAISTAAYALSFLLLPQAQSPMAALLLVATVAVAWSAGRADCRPQESVKLSPELQPEGGRIG